MTVLDTSDALDDPQAHPGSAAEPTAERGCPEVARLRARRGELVAEERRRAYLHRLVRATLDLEVAGTLGPPEPLDPVTALGEQEAMSVLGLPLGWPDATRVTGDDLVARLRRLDDGLERLDAYGDALHLQIEACTGLLVEALRRRPRSVLAPDAPDPAA